MGRQKNLHVIMSCIEELMAQDGLESDQKDDLAAALKAVKYFRRKVTPSDADVYRIVRIVAEKISKNFIR
jgi:CDP-diacylglycerol pyrophosphatase